MTSDKENEVSILTYFEAYPLAVRENDSTELAVSNLLTQRILKKHKWHDYKFRSVHNMVTTSVPTDAERRILFCNMVLKTRWKTFFIRLNENLRAKVL